MKISTTVQKSSILFSTILLTLMLVLIDISIRDLPFNGRYLRSILILFSLIYLFQFFLSYLHKSRVFIPITLVLSLLYSGLLLFQYVNYDIYHNFSTPEIYRTLILNHKYWFTNFTDLLDIKLIAYYLILAFIVFISFVIARKSFFNFNTHKLDKYKFFILLGSVVFIALTTQRVKFQTPEVSFYYNISSFLKEILPEPKVRTLVTIKAKKIDFNVLLLVNESLRSDHLNIYGYKRKTSPNISKYFKNALSYKKCFSPTAVTHIGLQSIFTGYYPNYQSFSAPTLWQYTSQLSLETFYFGSQVLSWSGGLDRFFLEYQHINKTFSPITSDSAVGHDDKITITAFKKYMKDKKSKPFFGVIHFNATHFPYLEHKKSDIYFPTSSTANTSKTESIINAYDNSILNLDDSIGQVMKVLEEKNILDNTIVILLSDHAEAFGEHKSFFHTSIMFNEALNVPLLISLPKKVQEYIGEEKLNILKSYQNKYISNVDIMPTILDIYEVLNTNKMNGISLLNKKEREYIFATTDTIDTTFTYINTINKNKYLFDNRSQEVYFTNLDRDPSENNLTTISMDRVQNRAMGMRYIEAKESKSEKP